MMQVICRFRAVDVVFMTSGVVKAANGNVDRNEKMEEENCFLEQCVYVCGVVVVGSCLI